MTDLSSIPDHELLNELRRRGNAVSCYDCAEILTMVDGWDSEPSERAIKEWFDKDDVEELMSAAVREEVSFLETY